MHCIIITTAAVVEVWVPVNVTYMKPISNEIRGSSSKHHFRRNAPYMLLVLFMTCSMIALDKWSVNHKIEFVTSSGRPFVAGKKPVIYRYLVVRKDQIEHERTIAGYWRTMWANAGWLPETIDLDERLKNSHFKEFLADVRDVPNLKNFEQKQVLWKYLAMAGSGGGWMANSDVFPLHPFTREGLELPNSGVLTIYSDEFPSLMSGSVEEWLRVARLLVGHAQTYSGNPPWTEQIALQDLVVADRVMRQSQVYTIRDEHKKSMQIWHSSDCTHTADKRAVHFVLDEREGRTWGDRSDDMVIKWLGMWQKTCERNPTFEVAHHLHH